MNSLDFRLNSLSVDYFHIINPKAAQAIDSIPLLGTHLPLNFDIQVNLGVNGKDNIVQMRINIKINTPFNDSIYYLGEIETAFDFILNNVEQYNKGGEQYEIPPQLISTFYSISYSTTRGLLFGHLNGTFLANTILPLIPINNLQKQEARTV